MIHGEVILIAVASLAVLVNLISLVALFWVTSPRRARKLPRITPPISILKPLRGLDEGLLENLQSFFELDYPQYQLLFCTADANDPAIDAVKILIEAYPHCDAQLIVGCPPFGLNPKVESLAAMDVYRKYDILLISDSNVRVDPSYLRETVRYMDSPRVGLVTNMFAGVEETQSGGALENMQLNGFIAGGIASAVMIGVTCVVGKSMLLRARVLKEIGGWESVRNVLAEDQVLGMRIHRAGYDVKMSHHVIRNVNHVRGLRWFLNRHSRWYKIRRRLALPFFLWEPLNSLALIGCVWAMSADNGFGWGGLIVLVGVGLIRDLVQCLRLRGSMPAMKYWPLSPIKELFLIPVWCDALVNQRVHWRGHRFLVGRGTLLRPVRLRPLRVSHLPEEVAPPYPLLPNAATGSAAPGRAAGNDSGDLPPASGGVSPPPGRRAPARGRFRRLRRFRRPRFFKSRKRPQDDSPDNPNLS